MHLNNLIKIKNNKSIIIFMKFYLGNFKQDYYVSGLFNSYIFIVYNNNSIEAMKNLYPYLFIFLFFSFSLKGANRFTEKQFFSQALNTDKTYYISLPDGYDESDTTKKFPVVIFLHGASVNAGLAVQQIEPYLSNTLTSVIFKNLFKVIFVVPDGSAEPFLGSFYTNSSLYGNFEDYIASDLLTEISTNYNTYDVRDKWAIMGHSMGGYGCMKIALKHPEDYIGVATLSAPLHITHYNDILPLLLEEHGDAPPYEYTYEGDVTKLIYSMSGAFSPEPESWPPVIFPVDTMGNVIEEVKENWELNNPINYVAGWQGNPNLAMYMYCGELDEYKLLSQNQLFSDTLDYYGIEHSFTIDPYGDHILSLITSMPEGLNFLYDVMTKSSSNDEVQQLNNQILLYPNPIKNYAVINIRNGINVESADIFSLTGIKFRHFSHNEVSNGRLFTGDLPAGCYIIQFNMNDNPDIRIKIIKE